MEIKNSNEIILEFIDRYNFSSVYVEESLPLGINCSTFVMDSDGAYDYLLSSALAGNKVIGFFYDMKEFVPKHPLRGECLFIVRNIPAMISCPTLFCRDAKELAVLLPLALDASRQSNMPIVIVLSDNALFNFADFVKPNIDLSRTSPYLHPATFKNTLSDDKIGEFFDIVTLLFEGELKDDKQEGKTISFKDTDYDFFKYLIPGKRTALIDKIIKGGFSAPENEAHLIERMINNTFYTSIKLKQIEANPECNFKDMLCPGCPFINIIKRFKNEHIFFTDVKCDALKQNFDINISTIESYIGLLSKNLTVSTYFIGLASSYKPAYDRLISGGSFILLSDCRVADIDGFTYIKHPKKISEGRDTIYPYSCRNIKKYSRVKINPKRCKCNPGDENICAVIDAVKCPAIYISNGKALIDQNLCTGCLICKSICKTGAIS